MRLLMVFKVCFLLFWNQLTLPARFSWHILHTVRTPTKALALYGQPFGHMTDSSMTVDKLEMQMHAADRMRMAREVIFEVHDAWLALTAAAAQDTSFIDLQFDPN